MAGSVARHGARNALTQTWSGHLGERESGLHHPRGRARLVAGAALCFWAPLPVGEPGTRRCQQRPACGQLGLPVDLSDYAGR
jgi:hypothetical protein